MFVMAMKQGAIADSADPRRNLVIIKPVKFLAKFD